MNATRQDSSPLRQAPTGIGASELLMRFRRRTMSFLKSDLFRSFFVGFSVTALALTNGALPFFG
jgi:hypothetical protein